VLKNPNTFLDFSYDNEFLKKMSKLQETRTLNKYQSITDHIFSRKITPKNKRYVETGDSGCYSYTPESMGTVCSPPSQPYLLRPRCNQTRIVHPRTSSGPLTKVQKSEALERFKTFLATGDLIKALQFGDETVDSAIARDEVVRYVVQLGSFLMEKVVVSDHQPKERYCLSESEAILLETILDEMRIRKRNHLLWAPPEVSCISMMEFLVAIEESKLVSENQINELIDQKIEIMLSQLMEEMQQAYENDWKELYGLLKGILQQFSDHTNYKENPNLLRTTPGSSNNRDGDSQHSLWKKLKSYWDQHLSDSKKSPQKSFQSFKSSFDHLSGNSSLNASFKKNLLRSHEPDPTDKVDCSNSMTEKLEGLKNHLDISQHVDSGFSYESVESVLKPISYNHEPSKGFQNKDITVDSGLSWFDNLGQVSVDRNVSLDKNSKSWIDASSKDWFDEIVANEVNHTSKYMGDKSSVIVSSTPVMNHNNNFQSVPFSPIERNPQDDIFKMPYSTLKSNCDSSSSSQTSFSLSFAKRKRCKKHLFSKKLFSQQNLTFNLKKSKCVKTKANPVSGVSEFSTNCTPTFIASGNIAKRNAANVGLKTNHQLETSDESSLIKTSSKSSSLDRTRLDLSLLASYGVKEKDPVKRNPTQNGKVIIRRKFR
jgi:hypothetical protein